MASPAHLPADFVDLLTEFAAAEVRYLVIGGYAVGFHDRPRTTKDLDLLLDDTAENTARACDALAAFGAPHEVVESLRGAGPEEIVWFGSPPARIDLLKSAGGVEFAAAHARRVQMTSSGIDISVVSIEDLMIMKRAAGRDQDLVDLKRLQRVLERQNSGRSV